jgi:hypothetical protein
MAAVDLRPMSLGEVLDRTFSIYKQNFLLFAGITLLPFLLLFAVNIAIAELNPGVARMGQGGAMPSMGMIGGFLAGGSVVFILYLFLAGAAHAATVVSVSDLYLGRTSGVREAYGRVGTRVFRVILMYFLLFLIVFIGVMGIVVLTILLRSPILGGVFMIVAVIAAVVLFCRAAVAVPAAILEDTGAVRSISRSFELTQGHGGQIFLIFLLTAVMSYVAIIIFQLPFLALAGSVAKAGQTPGFGFVVMENISTLIAQVLVGPIGTIALSLMYYNLRVRKEAFDVQHLMASLGTQPAPGTPSAI